MAYIATPIIMDWIAALLATALNLTLLTLFWYGFYQVGFSTLRKLRHWLGHSGAGL